jgi:hypothetical protein
VLDRVDVDAQLRLEQMKLRKLKILFGDWWPHYTVPYELRWTLWAERSACPYCGGSLGYRPADSEEEDGEALLGHIDHMDPLSRGGEDSIRNAAYVCARCNLAKGNRLFVDWLARLEVPHRETARAVYLQKHGVQPEAFVPGDRQARLTLGRMELQFDESVLKRLFKQPIVQGPPRASVAR